MIFGQYDLKGSTEILLLRTQMILAVQHVQFSSVDPLQGSEFGLKVIHETIKNNFVIKCQLVVCNGSAIYL